MPLPQTLLKILACPRCRHTFDNSEHEGYLACQTCRLAYPIRQGVPFLTEDDAFEISPEGKIMTSKAPCVYFKILDGTRQGEQIKLPLGACRAIGRHLDDLNKTQVLNSQMTVPLDDYTKKMVMNYLSKKKGKSGVSSNPTPLGGLGEYQRLDDLVFPDPAISRLHAMIFHDESGVGILDFASRNGTRVNGEEVESRTLKEKDVVKVGETQLQVSFTS